MIETPDLFYRVTAWPQPTAADFLSQERLYIDAIREHREPERPGATNYDGEALHMWSGVSTYSERDLAEQIMRRYPRTGAYIARLHVPDELIAAGTIRIERTGNRRAHYTLWGRPEALLACVQSA